MKYETQRALIATMAAGAIGFGFGYHVAIGIIGTIIYYFMIKGVMDGN